MKKIILILLNLVLVSGIYAKDKKDLSEEVKEEKITQSRLFIMPTSKNISKGIFYISNYELIFMQCGYGISEWLQIGGTVSLMHGNLGDQLYWVNIKAQLYKGKKWMPGIAFVGNYATFGFDISDNVKKNTDAFWIVPVFSFEGKVGGLHVAPSYSHLLNGENERNIWGMAGFEIMLVKGIKLMGEIGRFEFDSEFDISETFIIGIRIFDRKKSVDIGIAGSFKVFEDTDISLFPIGNLVIYF